MELRRLTTSDSALAQQTFRVMAEVFEETGEDLGQEYLEALLARPDFWAIAAVQDEAVLGGITAYALPLTRRPEVELFIYDLAVRADQQRRGVGRALVQELRDQAATEGINVTFVPADNEDTHALDFYRAIGGIAAPVTIFTFGDA